MKQSKPGDMFNAFQAKKNKKIKMTGTFHGKSNALGQGGRAAQLKAQGVPGGVIGNLARAAKAAPGQKNFHKRKKRKGSKKKLQPLGQNQAYGTNMRVPKGTRAPTPKQLGWGPNPLSQGTLKMGAKIKFKGMRCKKHKVMRCKHCK